MSVGVIGLGKLGVPLMAALAESGEEVHGLDLHQETVDALQTGEYRSTEPELNQLLHLHRNRLSFTTSYPMLVAETNMCFIVVPTPSTAEQPEFNSCYVEEAITGLVRQLVARKKRDYHIVVVSTVMPGTFDNVLWPRIVTLTHDTPEYRPTLTYSPEFIALGSVVEGLRKPDLLLVGSQDGQPVGAVLSTLQGIPRNDPPVYQTSWVNAELAKLSINAALGWKITLGNIISQVCDRLPGADCDQVARVVGADSRIGPKLLKGGMGYGGPCLPRDIRAMRSLSPTLGLLEAVDNYNEERNIGRAVWPIVQKVPRPGPIAVIGMAYKDGTPVLEESQPLLVADNLVHAGYDVRVCDSAIRADSKLAWSLSRFYWFNNVADCVANCRGIVLPKFTTQVAELAEVTLSPPCVVVDCWRQLKTTLPAGVEVISLGRGPQR